MIILEEFFVKEKDPQYLMGYRHGFKIGFEESYRKAFEAQLALSLKEKMIVLDKLGNLKKAILMRKAGVPTTTIIESTGLTRLEIRQLKY